jgi:hypothetical protein
MRSLVRDTKRIVTESSTRFLILVSSPSATVNRTTVLVDIAVAVSKAEEVEYALA